MCDGAAVPNDPEGDGLNLCQQIASQDSEFEFLRQPRKIEPVEAIPWRQPKTTIIANEWVAEWLTQASEALAKLSLSGATLRCVASHFSRRDWACCLTDKMISTRSGRSLVSTKRDIARLKRLGFLIAEYKPGKGRRKRERLLKIAIPAGPKKYQRVPPSDMTEEVSTCPPHVETLDMGERRDV